MYCGKCGTEITDGAICCPNCGQPINTRTQAGQTVQQSNKSKVRKILVPTAILVAIIVIVSVIVATGKGSYKKTLDNCYKAIETQDIKLMQSVLAQYFLDYQLAGRDEDDLEGDIAELIDDDRSEYECGDNTKITYSILREKDADDSELEELKADLYNWFEYYVYDRDDFYRSVTAAKIVTVRLRVVCDEDSNIFTSQLILIREKGKWKIAIGGPDTSFFRNNSGGD